MGKDTETTREKKFEVVYNSHVNDVYKVCLFYLKDEDKAADITQQAFFNFYKTFEKVHPDYTLAFLVREVKKLLPSNQNHKVMGKEVK